MFYSNIHTLLKFHHDSLRKSLNPLILPPLDKLALGTSQPSKIISFQTQIILIVFCLTELSQSATICFVWFQHKSLNNFLHEKKFPLIVKATLDILLTAWNNLQS